MIVSLDLDSTLCNTQHRWHLINEEDRAATDWDAYSMACSGDSEGPAFGLARALQELGARLVVCSARSFCAIEQTKKWLRDHGLRVERIVLYDAEAHGDGYKTNAISHSEWKAEALLTLNQYCIKRWAEPIAFHVDDQFKVKASVEAKAGIDVLVVHPGFEGFIA